MEKGKPTGGKYSFDKDNRKKIELGPPKFTIRKDKYYNEAFMYVNKYFKNKLIFCKFYIKFKVESVVFPFFCLIFYYKTMMMSFEAYFRIIGFGRRSGK